MNGSNSTDGFPFKTSTTAMHQAAYNGHDSDEQNWKDIKIIRYPETIAIMISATFFTAFSFYHQLLPTSKDSTPEVCVLTD